MVSVLHLLNVRLSDIAPVNSILCGDLAIKAIEEPFISGADNSEEWAI